MLSKRGTVTRIYLPPDANSLLSVADHCLRSRNYVNLIVIDKQPQLQWLSIDDALRARRARRIRWDGRATRTAASPTSCSRAPATRRRSRPSPRRGATTSRAGAARARRERLDLMTLFSPSIHPHGMPDARFVELFTRDKPVVFAFHGYQFAVHQLVHRRPHPARFHVRGFNEQGTTTTPFDMVI